MFRRLITESHTWRRDLETVVGLSTCSFICKSFRAIRSGD
jgi:hypothetical protein